MNKIDTHKLVASVLKTERNRSRTSELEFIKAVNDGKHDEVPLAPKPLQSVSTKRQFLMAFKEERLNWWRKLFDSRVTLDEAAGMLLGFSKVMAMDAKFVDTHKSNARAPRLMSSVLVTAFTDMRGDIADWHVTSDGKYRAADLIEWAKEKGYVADEVLEAWEAHQAETKMTQTKTVANDGPDYRMLASRDQLIKAFGAFTGMDATWFKNLKDTPQLDSARKVTGKGGRGRIAEPFFCPYEVMVWLIDPKRRKGKPIQPDTAWRMLETHFQTVYNERSIGDPREGVD